MAEYVDLPLVVDADALSLAALDYIGAIIPGWTARPASVVTVMLEGSGHMAAEVLDQASPIPPAVYATIAETIYGITRQQAVPAAATASIVFAATTPAVIVDAGTQVIVPHPSGDGA